MEGIFHQLNYSSSETDPIYSEVLSDDEGVQFLHTHSVDVAPGDIIYYQTPENFLYAFMESDEKGDYFSADSAVSNHNALLRAYAIQTTSVLLPYKYDNSSKINITIDIKSTHLNMTEWKTVEFLEAINDTTIVVDQYVAKGDHIPITLLPHTGEPL